MPLSFTQEAQQGPIQVKDQRTTDYMLGSSVHDRSFLSDEMAAMCDKYPINSIDPEEEIVSVEAHEQANGKLSKLLDLNYDRSSVAVES